MSDSFFSNFFPTIHNTSGSILAGPEQVLEALFAVVVISFLIERALAPIFESDFFITILKRARREVSVKPMVAGVISILVCVFFKLDLFAEIIEGANSSGLGYTLSGLVIAGGSKASIKLFRDFLGIYSNSYAEYKNLPTSTRRLATTSIPDTQTINRDNIPPVEHQLRFKSKQL